MELWRGRAVCAGRRSPFALYDHKLATYSAGDVSEHGAAKGFTDILGLGAKTANVVERKAREAAAASSLKEAS